MVRLSLTVRVKLKESVVQLDCDPQTGGAINEGREELVPGQDDDCSLGQNMLVSGIVGI